MNRSPDSRRLPQPYSAQALRLQVRASVLDGAWRALRYAPLMSLFCALIYDNRLWGLADGLGWAGLAYFIYFWFELGEQKPVEEKRSAHTLALMPEIDADDGHWRRAVAALTASLCCFGGYLLFRFILNSA